MSERGLLQEWLDEYGGSTFDGRKPCTPDLEARTRAALAAPEHAAPQASEQSTMGEGEAALPSSMPAGAAPDHAAPAEAMSFEDKVALDPTGIAPPSVSPQATTGDNRVVYQCPRCATSMEVDPTAKPSPRQGGTAAGRAMENNNDKWNEFGAACAGSRWFRGEPNLKKTPMRPVNVTWPCPVTPCDGEMRFNGMMWPTGDPGYHHTCTKCGFKAAIKGNKYPSIRYEESK